MRNSNAHFSIRHRPLVTPVSPLLARLIHISPSCWTIYLSLEIILYMGTVHWIGLQIQCYIPGVAKCSLYEPHRKTQVTKSRHIKI